MSYTLLRVTGRGVVLRDEHRRRLPGDAFRRWCAAAGPGVWAVREQDGSLRAERRAGSVLRDGIPVRLRVSPVLHRSGLLPKEPPPGPYGGVRAEGAVTLLTSADGAEIHEACVAAVVGWDGSGLVLPPVDRPRTWSTAESAIREHLGATLAPLRPASMPVLLVNAVAGTCAVTPWPGPAFPSEVRREIDALFERLTGR